MNKDIVTIVCYGKTEQMEREKAIAKYYDGMMCCDGSERNRYTNIYMDLINGLDVCKDEEDYKVYEKINTMNDNEDIVGVGNYEIVKQLKEIILNDFHNHMRFNNKQTNEYYTIEEILLNKNEIILRDKFGNKITTTKEKFDNDYILTNLHIYEENMDKYYDPFSDNYCIPIEKYTKELEEEVKEFLKTHSDYFLLYSHKQELDEIDGEDYKENVDMWCVTSWLE